MKKIIALALSAILLISAAVVGTIAYVTDTDDNISVSSVGDIDIEQYEKMRDENGALVDFKDSELWPAVISDGKSWNVYSDKLTVAGTVYDLWNKNDIKNIQDKIVYVENTGDNAAFVRTVFAFENPNGLATERVVKNVNGELDYVADAVIDGVTYALYVYDYGKLEAGAIGVSLLQIAFDETVDRTDILAINGSYEVFAFTQAVQTEGFANNYEEAMTKAFGAITATNHPWVEPDNPGQLVTTAAALQKALKKGGKITLVNDITADGAASIEIPEGVTATLNLNGKTLTNPVVGAAALINNGTLTVSGEGAIANGVNHTKASHTIRNYGTLVIESGNIGTDDTAGAAVLNEGIATINGGTFASKQENEKSDGLCAYAFINGFGDTVVYEKDPVMIINDATLNCETHGVFGCNKGEIIVNGGSYTLQGNGGLGCYIVYASAAGKVTLKDGSFVAIEPRHNRYFFVSANGSHFNENALATQKVELGEGYRINSENGTITISFTWEGKADTAWYDASATEFELGTAEELAGFSALVAEGNSFSGKTIKLTADIDLQGKEWTPIGQTGGYYASTYFQGSFDGQGYTIKNLSITETNEGDDYAAGLFGFLDCGMENSIKNIKIDGATVYGHHWTGVIAGYVSGTVENCHVTNATVVCTHANNEACGDKAGVIAGHINGTQGKIVDCTASNSTVSAGRDAGQIVGGAQATQVTGCTATNVTVSATGDCTGANIREEVIGRELEP